MKFYLAAPYARRPELANYADKLRTAGFIVTARWLTEEHCDEDTAHHSLKSVWCHEDLDDIDACDTLLLFTPGTERGGCMVEFGYALGRGKECVVIGPRTNIFTHHLYHNQFDSFAEYWDKCLTEMYV